MTVYTLDLLYQGFTRAIAAYLVEGPEGWLLVETGPMSTLTTLKEKVRAHGLEPADIKHVFVTHIHLDHAGAAGWWAQQGATVYVHHVGAPHIVDPSRLWSSARRIYGDRMETLWGEMIPAPAERIMPLYDGDVTYAAGLTVKAWDTPGHAWHHHVYQIGDLAFTGDVAGVRLAGDAWISLPAPPPEFDRDAWQTSLTRLRALDLQALYLTHFGKVNDVAAHLQDMAALLDEASAFIHRNMLQGMNRDALVTAYRQWNEERWQRTEIDLSSFHGRYQVANPLYMSVDGITRYWRKRDEKGTT